MYSVVVPCYNEQEVIEMFHARIKAVMDGIKENYEIIYVNDGSKDGTLGLLRQFASGDKTVKVLAFSRNFGHQAAVSAGLKYASGDAVAIIDSDLQDPPEVLPGMFDKWKEGYKIVYGKRKKRKKEGLLKRLTAHIYYRFLHSISGVDIPRDTGDFRVIDRDVVNVINAMPERHRYLRGLNAWIGMRPYAYEYDRDPRAAGETHYTLKKMINLATDGIVGFSTAPLTFVLTLGVILSVLSVCGGLAGLICSLCGVTVATFVWVIIAMGFLAGLNMFGMGLIGVYVGRTYDEIKDRPLFIIEDRINF